MTEAAKPPPVRRLAMPFGLCLAMVLLAARNGRELPDAITKPDVPRAPDWKPWK